MAELLAPPAVMTPREIVSELDRYIVGQHDAKRAVAIALRNRWRRQKVAPELRDEIAPKNILMIGPTGVGKTEIARRLAKLAQAPFIKVEASQYTEVGYAGRDVASMIPDLTELAVTMVKAEMAAAVRERAEGLAEERLLGLLLARRPGEPLRSGPPGAVPPRRHPRQAPRPAPLRQARRAPDRDGRAGAGRAHVRGPPRTGHGGDRDQPEGHAVELPARAHPAAAGQDRGGAAAPRPGGGPEAGRRRRGGGPGDPAGRGLRDRLPR